MGRMKTFATIALMGMSAATQAGIIDISSAFNADTIATSVSDSAGVTYRDTAQKDRFLTTNFPIDGLFSANGYAFQLGSYAADNTVLMKPISGAGLPPASVTIDIADQRMSTFAFVHTGVGYGSQSPNGSVTVNYLDGTSDSFTWDLADNNGSSSNGSSVAALTNLQLKEFGTANPINTNRQLWSQTITGINQAKTVASITFNSTNSSGDPDAHFGVYALTSTSSKYLTLDLSGSFNRDTIAIDNAEPTGNGYRSAGQGFITTNHNQLGNSPNIPPTGELIAGNVVPFQVGPFDSPNTVQNNTLILDVDNNNGDGVFDNATIDIANQAAEQVSVLFSAVGFNNFTGTPTNPNNNGFITIHYTTGADDVFEWDVADSDGNNKLVSGGALDAFTGTIDLFDTNSNSLVATNRHMWYQTFTVDPTRVIDTINLSVNGVKDGSGTDAEFGIYAVTLTVPEPASAALMALLFAPLVRRRR